MKKDMLRGEQRVSQKDEQRDEQRVSQKEKEKRNWQRPKDYWLSASLPTSPPKDQD